jgi:uncharacterized protein YajQ (UPF0234 family)
MHRPLYSSEDSMSSSTSPVVVDLGKHKRKAIKKLIKGEGPLIGDVQSVVADLRVAGTIAQDAQPVVIVLREKKKKNKLGMGFMGR